MNQYQPDTTNCSPKKSQLTDPKNPCRQIKVNVDDSDSGLENSDCTDTRGNASSYSDDEEFVSECFRTKNTVNRIVVKKNFRYYDCKQSFLDVLPFYTTLLKGAQEPIDFSDLQLKIKPSWLDEAKFKRGQKFAREHLFSIDYAQMISLFLIFVEKEGLGPLIYTGKSDTPYTAYRRYLSTLTRVLSWYKDDVWNEEKSKGKSNILIVRTMHKNVFESLNATPADKLEDMLTLGDPKKTALWCPLREILLCDFRESLKPNDLGDKIFKERSEAKVWLNQRAMSMTQFAFVGLTVTYPKSFGIHSATDDDLDDFLHLWRGLGYLLGIKDEYNFCNASINTVRKRVAFYIEKCAKPHLRNVSCDWEHMCRCLVSGISFYLPGLKFETPLLYLCHVIGADVPRLRKKLDYKTIWRFYFTRLVFYLMKFGVFYNIMNLWLYKIIKKTQNLAPEVLAEYENRRFSYMDQPGKCPIRDVVPC